MENITYVYLEKKTSIWEYVVLVWLKTPLLSFPLNVCFFFVIERCLVGHVDIYHR